jgi:tRNA(Ile2) C34 agmatinyltransferase TiaS
MQQPQIFNAKDCEDEIARFGSLEDRVTGLDKVFKLQAAAVAPVVKCSNGPCPRPGTVNVVNTDGVKYTFCARCNRRILGSDSDSGSDTD